MDKLYQRINYANSPSKKTPLNETNLNKMDKALDDLDNRIIEQDAAFAKSIEEEGKKIEETNKKVSDLAGVTEDYNQSKADAITVEKSGITIVATDSSDKGFEQFRTFGWGKQEKTLGNQLFDASATPDAKSHSYAFDKDTGVYTFTQESSTYVINRWRIPVKANTNITIKAKSISSGGAIELSDYLQKESASLVDVDISAGVLSATVNTGDYTELTISIYNTVTGTITIDGLMVSYDADAEYEPYTNGPSPNPEYPQPIVSAGQKLENGIVSDVGISKKLTGANLLDVSKLAKKTLNTLEVSQEGYTIKISGNVAYAQSSRIALPLDIVKGNTVFASQDSIEGDGEGRIYLECISPSGTKSASTKDTLSVSLYIPQDATACNVLLMAVGGVASDVDKSNILKGARITLNSDAEWEPYTEQTLTLNRVLNGIPLGQTIPDIIKSSPAHMDGVYWDDETQQYYIGDTEDGVNGVYVQRVGERLYNGDEDWGMEAGNWSNTNTFYSTIPAVKTKDSRVVICTHYINDSINNQYNLSDKQCTLYRDVEDKYPNQNWFYLRNTDYASADELKSALVENPITVKYILATPIETPLTDEEIAAYKALHSNKPTTIITNDAGCYMEVEYVADPKNHIEQNYVPVSKYTALEERVSALEQLHV